MCAGTECSGGLGGLTQFDDNSTAANSVFNDYGGTVRGAEGGLTSFMGAATAFFLRRRGCSVILRPSPFCATISAKQEASI